MKRLLLDVPVYSIPQNDYEKRKTIYFDWYQDHLKKTVINDFWEISPQNIPWQYNQIMGYCRLYIDNETKDLSFEIWKTSQKKIYVFSHKKNIFQLQPTTGFHFRYEDLSINQVLVMTRRMLSDIRKKYFKNRYLDTTLLDNNLIILLTYYYSIDIEYPPSPSALIY